MGALLRGLQQKETPAELQKGHASKLDGRLKKGAAALGKRQQAVAARDAASDTRDGWKAKGNSALQALDGALTTYAAAHGEDTKWVDAFFLPPRKANKRNKGGSTGPA